MWAPISEPFSTTTTEMSGDSCFNRIAAASPDGPAPTITTSNSIDSRAGNSCSLIGRSCRRAERKPVAADLSDFRALRYGPLEMLVGREQPLLDRRPVRFGD